MTKLKNFFTECLSLPWVSNLNDFKHETQIEDLLRKHDISYVRQPFGSQKFPDFHICLENDEVISLECKSVKTGCPLWNGSYPKKDGVYIVSSKKHDSTTIFFGQDVVSVRKQKLYSNLVSILNFTVKVFQSLPWWKDPRGFDFYMRSMYTQSGGAEFTDYFTHTDKELCENNVLRFFGNTLD
jgi:hypothetical protein|tara:strand:+ start:56 stop:604 length:549 start_codon:yes stop_codon:yes gene_type:complete